MKKTLFNAGWQCKRLVYDEKLLNIKEGLNEENWFDVEVPHDALIHDFFSFYEPCVIWYRNNLNINRVPGKRYYVYFEGVYMDATIYINGKELKRQGNGFTSFWLNITHFLNDSDNRIYVSINYQTPNARWYAGPGIIRDVYLYESLEDEVFMPDSLYVSPQFDGNSWKVYLSVEFEGEADKIIFNIGDNAVQGTAINQGFYEAEIPVENPVLWDLENPVLHTARAQLVKAGRVVDTIESRFGYRYIKADPNEGFFLNGKHIKLRGVCLHSDGGAAGAAYSHDIALRQLTNMKEMGANAVRCAHNVTAPDFMNLCDELGLLVMGEAFDCWKGSKTEFDYGRKFEAYYHMDICSWICRDRNHPSVIMWSAGNEIYDTNNGEEGRKTLNDIVREIRKYDYKENAFITLCSNYMGIENTEKAVDDLKIVGYNYGEDLYDAHHAKHPDWVIFGSETGSVVHSRNVYHFPYETTILADDDEQCSALGNSSTSWGARDVDFCIATERDKKYSMGQFLWSGIDYIGEPTPYHTKNSYFGLSDTACFPKDPYYIFQNEWHDFETTPLIHIFPYWDFNERQPIDIRVASNAPRVALFYNDNPLGIRDIDHENGCAFAATYRMPYKEGTLRAVGYDKDGNVRCEAVKKSFGDVEKLVLSEDTICVKEGDRTIRFIEINGVDCDGNFVENGVSRVNITLNGPGRIFGLDNGDSTDTDSYKGSSKRLFGGKLLLMVKPTGEKGVIRVNATIDTEEIPVRKLEIIAPDTRIFTPANPELDIEIVKHPANANNGHVELKIVNNSGVEVKCARIENCNDDNTGFTLRALGDSEFKLRAINREDSGRVNVISEITLISRGFGAVNINPYEFVSASLYNSHFGDVGIGNEKGISTPRDGDCYVVYDNIDFGETGSDTVDLDIFELDNRPFPVSIWDGVPYSATSEKICEQVYDKVSIWNVYQADTFKLSNVLKGIHSIGIETKSHKMHLKGFTFKEYNPARELNRALDADEIYGDSFEKTEELVKGIGNNVSIVFRNFDFGEKGTGKLRITGKTTKENNPITVSFKSDDIEEKRIVNFACSEEIEEQCFEFEPVCGKFDVSFIFLPGSDFDFKHFMFE